MFLDDDYGGDGDGGDYLIFVTVFWHTFCNFITNVEVEDGCMYFFDDHGVVVVYLYEFQPVGVVCLVLFLSILSVFLE